MTRGEAINYLTDLNIPPEKIRDIVEALTVEGKSDFRRGYDKGYAGALERVNFVVRDNVGDCEFWTDINGKDVRVVKVSVIESALRTCGCKEKNNLSKIHAIVDADEPDKEEEKEL